MWQIVTASRLGRMPWLENLLLAGNLLLVFLIGWQIRCLWPRFPLYLVVFLATVPAWAWAGEALAKRWHGGFTAYYEQKLGSEAFREAAGANPNPGRICVLDYRAYPFFGSGRQHRVCQPMYVESPEWLLNYLKENEVRLVVGRRGRTFPGSRNFLWFDQCLDRYPQRFRKVNETGGLVVFQVVE